MHEITEFKGNKVLKLKRDVNDFGFSFGLNKAKLILENLEAIKEFVDNNQKVITEKVEE